MELIISLLVLLWGLAMLKVAITFASKPLTYSIIPYIFIVVYMFMDKPFLN